MSFLRMCLNEDVSFVRMCLNEDVSLFRMCLNDPMPEQDNSLLSCP